MYDIVLIYEIQIIQTFFCVLIIFTSSSDGNLDVIDRGPHRAESNKSWNFLILNWRP